MKSLCRKHSFRVPEDKVARHAILGLSPADVDNLNIVKGVVNESGLGLHLGCPPSLR